MKAYRVTIYLDDDEWGNELMARCAREFFDQHPHLDPLVVEVYEHAGWFLTFDRQGRIVESANNTAVYPAPIRAFWASLEDAEWAYLPSIQRDNLVPSGA